MSSNDSPQITMTLEDYFLYLMHAVMCIPQRYQTQVFNDMARKLMEWNNTPISELRAVFRKMDIHFEELCNECNESLPDWEGEDNEDAICETCQTHDHD